MNITERQFLSVFKYKIVKISSGNKFIDDLAKAIREEFPNLEQVPNAIYRSNNMMFVNIKNHSLIENERLQELFKFILNSDTFLRASWDVVQSLQKKVEATRRSKDMAVVCYVSKGRLDERYDDGRREGISIGEQSCKMDMIQRMYADGMSVSMISKYSNLSTIETEKLIRELQES